MDCCFREHACKEALVTIKTLGPPPLPPHTHTSLHSIYSTDVY